MNREEFGFILQEGEGLKIEFKESLKNIDREIVAFANAEGGRIFLGIDDYNKVRGVRVDNKLKSQVQDIADNCDPPVKIGIEGMDNVLIISVKEGDNKPYRCKDGFFIRLGPNSQKLSRDEILEIATGEGKIRFDEIPNRDFDFKEFDKDKLNAFLEKAGITKTIKNEDVLINLGVAKRVKGKIQFNNAGVLFFSREPYKIVRQAYVTCIRFSGTQNVDIIDRVDLKDDIISNIDNAIKFVRRNTRLSYEIKAIKRREIPEYPTEAIREAVINALMHRNYFEKGANVFVNIFDDRLEVYNPGGLPKGLDKKDFGKKGVRRNPLIADILHRAGYVEKAGTGISRMKRAMMERGLPEPKIEITDFFTITFYSGGVIKGLGEKLGEKLGENQKKILNLVKEDRFITIPELSRGLKISTTAIENNIVKLKKRGLLRRVGPAKGGHWKIAERG